MTTLGAFVGGGIKNVTSVVGSAANWPAGGQGGASLGHYLDVTINAVDMTKTCIRPIYDVSANGSVQIAMGYRLISATVVRCESSHFNNATSPVWYGFAVEEYK